MSIPRVYAEQAVSIIINASTKEEALKYIDEVVHMVIDEFIEDGDPIPEDVQVFKEPLVSVYNRTAWILNISS